MYAIKRLFDVKKGSFSLAGYSPQFSLAIIALFLANSYPLSETEGCNYSYSGSK